MTGAEDRELIVRCMTHGLMQYDEQRAAWVCHGWDGEGCAALTTDQDAAALRAAAARAPTPHGQPEG
jgi:hypothetical protein